MTHPIINILKTEWDYLGKRKKIFIFYISLFVIAGIIELATPYVLGLIFNSIQSSITDWAGFRALAIKISLLLVITLVFWAFHGIGRVLETTTSFYVKKNYINVVRSSSALQKKILLPNFTIISLYSKL